jgi:hypothetical protein
MRLVAEPLTHSAPSLAITAQRAVDYIADLSPHQRLQKAGVFSDDFWLAALM